MPKPTPAKAADLFPSPSPYSDEERRKLVDVLNLVQADGLALEMAVYLAHRNLRGEHFAGLHPLFGAFAERLGRYTDDVPEFVAMLGGLAIGTAEQVAKMSRLDPYPDDVTDGIEHCRELTARIKVMVAGLHEAAVVADSVGACDALDLVTKVMRGVEKYGWQIAAHLVGNEEAAEGDGPESGRGAK